MIFHLYFCVILIGFDEVAATELTITAKERTWPRTKPRTRLCWRMVFRRCRLCNLKLQHRWAMGRWAPMRICANMQMRIFRDAMHAWTRKLVSFTLYFSASLFHCRAIDAAGTAFPMYTSKTYPSSDIRCVRFKTVAIDAGVYLIIYLWKFCCCEESQVHRLVAVYLPRSWHSLFLSHAYDILAIWFSIAPIDRASRQCRH